MRRLVILLVSTALSSTACSGDPDFSSEIRKNWLQAFYISSASGAPALLPGDRILVDKRAYRNSPPSRGDIMVFRVSASEKGLHPRDRYPTGEPRLFIHRIAGLPDDRIRIDNGDVYINGEAEPVSPLPGSVELEGQSVLLYRVANPPGSYRIARLAKAKPGSFPEITVEPNRYFVLGDNRDRAHDSRYWGTVHRDDILGKAWLIYFSTTPGTLWLRPSRLFQAVHESAV